MAQPLILARTFKDAHAYAQDTLGLRIGHYRVVNSPGTIKAVRGRDLHLVPGWDKRPDRFSMRSAIRYCRNTVIDVAAQSAAPVDPRGDLTERMLEVAHRYNALLDLAAYEAALPKVEIRVVSDDTPTPQHHVDMVAAVLPPKATDFFDEPEVAEEKPVCIDCGLDPHAPDCVENSLEPEGWEPPESLNAEQILRLAAGESGAEVAPMEDRPTPTVASPEAEALAAKKPGRRRSRCKQCGTLHYKEDPCPEGDE